MSEGLCLHTLRFVTRCFHQMLSQESILCFCNKGLEPECWGWCPGLEVSRCPHTVLRDQGQAAAPQVGLARGLCVCSGAVRVRGAPTVL